MGDFKSTGNLFSGRSKGRDSDCLTEDGGQLASYVLRQIQEQQLLYAFAFIVYPKTAHLLRFDRSCVVVTQAFNWQTEDHLAQFFCAVSSASLEELGQDDTISVPHASEAALAYRALADFARLHQEYFPLSDFLDEKNKQNPDLRQITVHDDACSALERSQGKSAITIRRFISPPPHIVPSSVIGRGTTAYLAVEVSEQPIAPMKRRGDSPSPPPSAYTPDPATGLYVGDVVFIKDTWRVDAEGMEKEGDIYCDLHDQNVSHISGLVCAGDIRHGEGAHRTGLAKPTNSQPISSASRIEGHCHYRLVLGKVGMPLTKFRSTQDLLRAIHDALKGKVVIITSGTLAVTYAMHLLLY